MIINGPVVDTCPHLVGSSKECRVTKGGLFLPMPEHIEFFCGTANYAHCPQYLRGCENVRESARQCGYIDVESRRQFRRVHERLPLLLAVQSENGRHYDLVDDHAYTIDLSLGGLRLGSHAEMAPNRMISFVFSKEFITPDWKGTGAVRWVEPVEGGKSFQSGISFADKATSQVIGRHLGVPGFFI